MSAVQAAGFSPPLRQRMSRALLMSEPFRQLPLAAEQVRSLYQYRLDGGTGAGIDPHQARAAESAERHYRLAALEQEREVLLRMARHNQLSDEIARKLLREIRSLLLSGADGLLPHRA